MVSILVENHKKSLKDRNQFQVNKEQGHESFYNLRVLQQISLFLIFQTSLRHKRKTLFLLKEFFDKHGTGRRKIFLLITNRMLFLLYKMTESNFVQQQQKVIQITKIFKNNPLFTKHILIIHKQLIKFNQKKY